MHGMDDAETRSASEAAFSPLQRGFAFCSPLPNFRLLSGAQSLHRRSVISPFKYSASRITSRSRSLLVGIVIGADVPKTPGRICVSRVRPFAFAQFLALPSAQKAPGAKR